MSNLDSNSSHIYAKKSLGQNFLRSTKALREIVEAADLSATDTVIEIGPGEGVLTA
jgi:16S rRNA (adenine1518-N6/adenine1519-N6)-dimethyltransferase